MFTPEQDVQWWATRLKFAREWKKRAFGVDDIAMVNYAQLLTAAFTVLFNVRLARRLSK